MLWQGKKMNLYELARSKNLDLKIVKKLLASSNGGAIPVLAGKVGVGKSAICLHLAKELNLDFVDFRLSEIDESIVMGIPNLHEQGAFFSVKIPQWVERAENATKNGYNGTLLMLDELSRAQNLNSVLRLMTERTIGDRKLPENLYIIGATNEVIDDESVNEFSNAFLNRICIMRYDVSLNQWLTWAKSNVPTIICQFLQKNEQFFWHKDKSESEAQIPFATPRSWTNLGKYMSIGEFAEDDLSVVSHYVGKSASLAFCKFWLDNQQFNLQDIIEGKPIDRLTHDDNIRLTNELLTKVETIKKLKGKKSENLFCWIKTVRHDLFASVIASEIDTKELFFMAIDGSDLFFKFMADVEFRRIVGGLI
jgi:hypothetical protein